MVVLMIMMVLLVMTMLLINDHDDVAGWQRRTVLGRTSWDLGTGSVRSVHRRGSGVSPLLLALGPTVDPSWYPPLFLLVCSSRLKCSLLLLIPFGLFTPRSPIPPLKLLFSSSPPTPQYSFSQKPLCDLTFVPPRTIHMIIHSDARMCQFSNNLFKRPFSMPTCCPIYLLSVSCWINMEIESSFLQVLIWTHLNGGEVFFWRRKRGVCQHQRFPPRVWRGCLRCDISQTPVWDWARAG